MFSFVSDTGYAQGRPIARDGADFPPGQATARPAHLLTGARETADFELSFPAPRRVAARGEVAAVRVAQPRPVRVREHQRSVLDGRSAR
jgi:hypothetical protein